MIEFNPINDNIFWTTIPIHSSYNDLDINDREFTSKFVYLAIAFASKIIMIDFEIDKIDSTYKIIDDKFYIQETCLDIKGPYAIWFLKFIMIFRIDNGKANLLSINLEYTEFEDSYTDADGTYVNNFYTCLIY